MPERRSYLQLTVTAVFLTCSLFGELVHQHQASAEVERGQVCSCPHHHSSETPDSPSDHEEDECRVCQVLAVAVDVAAPSALPEWAELACDVEPVVEAKTATFQLSFAFLRGPPTV